MVPSYAWMIDTTVELTNTTGATIDDVYFMRGLDPDNCKTQTTAVCDSNGDGVADATGQYATHNAVVSQGSASTTALVTATQTDDTYLGLRATGPEGRVFTQNAGFSSPADLAALWSGADASYDASVGSRFGDNGIYSVVHVPSIAAGASATVHVQYVVKEVPAASDFAVTVPAASSTSPRTTAARASRGSARRRPTARWSPRAAPRTTCRPLGSAARTPSPTAPAARAARSR